MNNGKTSRKRKTNTFARLNTTAEAIAFLILPVLRDSLELHTCIVVMTVIFIIDLCNNSSN